MAITRDDVVEARARAMHDGPLGADDHDFDAPESKKAADWCREMAEATMQADAALGLALVPVEATEGMAVAFAYGTMEMQTKDIRWRLNAAIDVGDILKGDGK